MANPRPARVLVCGTNYGRLYLEAVESARGAYDPAGILARGSARSQKAAERYQVPLYRTVQELPLGIDVACAAMGASGAGTTLELLKRGIHVLCEHPQETNYLETALATAAAHGVRLHLNGHFAELDASRAFIMRCAQLRRSERPAFVDAMQTDRSLYGTLDILKRALETFQPFEFDLTSSSWPFAIVQGVLAGIPATFRVQRSDAVQPEAVTGIVCRTENGTPLRPSDPATVTISERVKMLRSAQDEKNGKPESALLADGSREYLVDYRIAVGFPSGTLTLMSTSGPVVWNSSLYRVGGRDLPLWEFVDATEAVSFARLREQRVRANLHSLDALLRNVREGILPRGQRPESILEVSRAWEAIGRKLRSAESEASR